MHDLRLGSTFEEGVRAADVILALVTLQSWLDERTVNEVDVGLSDSAKRVIPLWFMRSDLDEGLVGKLRNRSGVVYRGTGDPEQAIRLGLESGTEFVNQLAFGLEQLVSVQPRPITHQPAKTSVCVDNICIENIRCFSAIELDFKHLTMIAGDNSAGKSTLLRAIALGLCSTIDGNALVKSGRTTLLRHGCKKGLIRLRLRHSKSNEILDRQIEVSEEGITADSSEGYSGSGGFAVDDIFVCGYGTSRSQQATASHESYSTYNSLLPLFDYSTALQNSEVALGRQDPRVRPKLERLLMSVLMLDTEHTLQYTHTGVAIHGPWGSQPLQSVSDGYRSTAQWLIDFLSWALFAGRFRTDAMVGGILLIDELEQHLHPSWQRHVVQRLRAQLPDTQIFATTHTPLLAGGVADVENSTIIRLRPNADGTVEAITIDPATLRGKRADQILTSDAFSLVTTRSPGSESNYDRYSELLSMTSRSELEEQELERLKSEVQQSLRVQETPLAQEVENAVRQYLKNSTYRAEQIEFETRRQVKALTEGDDE